MMKAARLLLPALLVVVAFASGCGVGHTAAETDRSLRRTAVYDAYMLVDDTALLFQTDRPLRTSRWVVR